MLIEEAESLQVCPRCDSSLNVQKAKRSGRSRFPIGAFAAALVLTSLAGGTYWYAANASDSMPDGFAQFGLGAMDIVSRPSSPIKAATENDTGTQNDSQNKVAQEPLPLTLPLTLPANVAIAARDKQDAGASSSNPSVDVDSRDDSTNVTPKTQTQTNIARIQLPNPNLQNSNPNSKFGAGARSNPEQPAVSRLTWHQDYLAGYEQALDERKLLMMVFRDSATSDSVSDFVNRLAVPSLERKLGDVARVILPVEVVTPGSDDGQPLLAHRSFRHLGVRPGVVIVDFRDKTSKLYGRVISAMRQPPAGQYSPDSFETLLELPSGTIQQRSLLQAVRTSAADRNFSTSRLSGSLNELANRNARYMAHFGQQGTFDNENRRTQIVEEFGTAATSTELVWASSQKMSLHEAARQAVESWTLNPADYFQMTQTSTDYGIDLIQEPTTGLWYATCVIVHDN